MSRNSILLWLGSGVLAIFTAVLLLLLAMTQPRISTPIVNYILGERISVERAWLRFPSLLSLEFRNASIGDAGDVDTGVVSINPFGILPGVSPASMLKANGGEYALAERRDQSSGPVDYERWVHRVSLKDIDIIVPVTDGSETVTLEILEGNARSGDLSGDVLLRDGKIFFDGRTENFKLRTWQGTVTLSGDNLAYAAQILQISAPDTPPYQLQLEISAEGENVETKIDSGQIGDSDISGSLELDFQTAPPTVTADLLSESLDFDDLGILFGIPVGVGEDETVGSAQQRARAAYEDQSRLIPNAAIDTSRLDAVDGTISYRALQVSDAFLDIQGFELELEIEDRVVRVSPAEIQFSSGIATAFATLDATVDPALTDVKADLSDVASQALSLDPFLKGTLNGQLSLSGQGNGFRDFAETVSGTVDLWSDNAELLAIAAEAAGLDLIEALLVSGPNADPNARTYTPVQCSVVRLEIETGAATFNPAILDTADSTIAMDGRLLLSTEKLDFEIRADAKDASWGALLGDVSVRGDFTDPKLNFLGAETVLQITVAALLASAAAPLAALPFIETGASDDYPCKSIVALAEQSE